MKLQAVLDEIVAENLDWNTSYTEDEELDISEEWNYIKGIRNE